MNRKYLGDSDDLVKRFFTKLLSDRGYEVFVDPFFTGGWQTGERLHYYKLIGARLHKGRGIDVRKALLMDPDTGIGRKRRKENTKHVTTQDIVKRLEDYQYGLVVVFDQSFSFRGNQKARMKEKMSALEAEGVSCFYYDSHAKFLFASLDRAKISKLSDAIIRTGIPSDRIIHLRSGRRRR